MRILIVEDEPKMARVLRRGLEEEGHAIDVANDGVDGLHLATENEYDGVVLDVMLPGLDGVEVCRQMRESGRWAPVLMLTARDAVSDRIRGLDAGTDDYLLKPFAFDELVARLRALLRRGASARPSVLFDRFYRVDRDRTRDAGGAGLGLAICRSIAEAHLGNIGVETTLGDGSTFTVRIPKS